VRLLVTAPAADLNSLNWKEEEEEAAAAAAISTSCWYLQYADVLAVLLLH